MIFNASLPKPMPFVNGLLKKKGLQQVVQYCHLHYGLEKTVEMLDSLKNLGFTYATRSGLSIGIDDLVIPQEKAPLVERGARRGDQGRGAVPRRGDHQRRALQQGHRRSGRTSPRRSPTRCSAEMEDLDQSGKNFNPVYIMADSGARGSKQQIRQLAGMRGLMAKPSGEIIETPITSNFREGLTVLQYFISTHGARKGLADTALKTADSGYLTRRLVDVAQDVIIHEIDCGTMDGIEARAIVESGEIIEPLRDRIIGRVTLEKIIDPLTGDVIVDVNDAIDEDKSSAIQEGGIEKVRIRSVLTCASRRGCCAKCYGRDLSTGKLVELGLAVGVIAAQSIGEPGTQLTMRTFHIGGTASRVSEQSTLDAKHAGTVRYQGLQVVETKGEGNDNAGQRVVMNRTGSLVVQDAKGRDRERYPIVYGARLKVADGQTGRGRPDPRRVGSVHVLDPHRGRGHGEVQGPHQRRHVSRGSRRGHRPVAEDRRRLAGREEAAAHRGPRQGGQGDAEVPHAVARPPHGRGRRGGVRRRGAREDSARDHEDEGHHGRSAARRRAVRGAEAARDGGHLGDRRHRAGTAASSRGSGRSSSSPRTVASRESTRCRAACTSTSRKATASAPASR